MKLRHAHLILVDISGYTQFIRLHRMSVIHAEHIITELLESVIDAASLPLVLNKLEGDAALFYAFADEGLEDPDESSRHSAAGVLRQVERFFEVFRRRERELVSECTLCMCDACARAGELRIKVIAHTGMILVKKIRQFEEIAGEDVILAHRLLKNSIDSDEYLLLTDSFYALSGPPGTMPLEELVETYPDHGEVTVHVAHLNRINSSPVRQPISLWRRLGTTLRLESHLVKRVLGARPRRFQHLPSKAPTGRSVPES